MKNNPRPFLGPPTIPKRDSSFSFLLCPSPATFCIIHQSLFWYDKMSVFTSDFVSWSVLFWYWSKGSVTLLIRVKGCRGSSPGKGPSTLSVTKCPLKNIYYLYLPVQKKIYCNTQNCTIFCTTLLNLQQIFKVFVLFLSGTKDLGHFWLGYIRILGHLQLSAHLPNFERL